VCDGYAANGPYQPDSVPEKPHPLCMCFLRVVPGAAPSSTPEGTMDTAQLAAALTGF
jgi:hypothetical protein